MEQDHGKPNRGPDDVDRLNPRVTGALGGKARARRLSSAERVAAAKRAAAARYSSPKEIASGELRLVPNTSIPCAVLDNGRRVLSTRGVSRAFGSRKTGTDVNKTGAPQPPPFLASAAIKPFLSDELIVLLNSPIEYRPKIGGRTAYGYDCAILPMICKAIIAADRANRLKVQQQVFAVAAHAMLESLIGVAMIALVDEATGYQYERDRDALATILKKFIGEKLAPWVKTFPDDYYRELCRLRSIRCDDQQRPQYLGHLTNDIVYMRLAPGVRRELEARNPRLPATGRRKHHHHQLLTRDVGHPELKSHLAVVSALMRLSSSYEKFVEQLDHVAPRYGDNFHLLSFDQMQPNPLDS